MAATGPLELFYSLGERLASGGREPFTPELVCRERPPWRSADRERDHDMCSQRAIWHIMGR